MTDKAMFTTKSTESKSRITRRGMISLIGATVLTGCSGSSESKTYDTAEWASSGSFEYKIAEVRTAESVTYPYGGDVYPDSQNGVMTRIIIDVKNQADSSKQVPIEGGIASYSSSLKLVDGEGREYSVKMTWYDGTNKLNPGMEKRFVLIYEIPSNVEEISLALPSGNTIEIPKEYNSEETTIKE